MIHLLNLSLSVYYYRKVRNADAEVIDLLVQVAEKHRTWGFWKMYRWIRKQGLTDNPYIESFNGSFRDECLNVNWFLSMEDAEEKIEAWRQEYNGFRPHSSLNDLTPNQIIEKHQLSPIPLL